MTKNTTAVTEKKKQARAEIAKQREVLKAAKEEEMKQLEDFCQDLEIDAHYDVIKRWQEDEFIELRKVKFRGNDYGRGLAVYFPLCPSADDRYYGCIAEPGTESRLFCRDPLFDELESCIIKDGTVVSTKNFNRPDSGGYAVSYDRIFILTFTFYYRQDYSVHDAIIKAKRLIEQKRFYFAKEENLMKVLFKKSLEQS